MVYIYYLYDPVEKVPFYVGFTKNPKMRMCDHECFANHNNVGRASLSKKEQFIYDRYKQGVRVQMLIIEEVEPHLARIRERYHYVRFKWHGHTLTNTAKNWNTLK